MLLEKFDNIIINNEQRITEADRAFCEAEEKLYSASVSLYMSLYTSLLKQKEIENAQAAYREIAAEYFQQYVEEFGDFGIDNLRRKIKQAHNLFISNICQYFSHVYDIKIGIYYAIEFLGYHNVDENQSQQNLMQALPYKLIVDKIILDLDGHSFGEKAIQEIKADSIKSAYAYNDKPLYTIQNKKITFGGLNLL